MWSNLLHFRKASVSSHLIFDKEEVISYSLCIACLTWETCALQIQKLWSQLLHEKPLVCIFEYSDMIRAKEWPGVSNIFQWLFPSHEESLPDIHYCSCFKTSVNLKQLVPRNNRNLGNYKLLTSKPSPSLLLVRVAFPSSGSVKGSVLVLQVASLQTPRSYAMAGRVKSDHSGSLCPLKSYRKNLELLPWVGNVPNISPV